MPEPRSRDSNEPVTIRRMNPEISGIGERLDHIRERIERAAVRSGRSADDVTIVGVSKTFSADRIAEAYAGGIRHFGENRVQEWEAKRSTLADLDAVWHLVGHLQSNKAARAVKLFHCVDSLDSLDLAQRLDHAFASRAEASPGKRIRVLIEVRVDPTPTKSGASAEELPAILDRMLTLPRLEVKGLMGVPPMGDPERVRSAFCRLRELRDAAEHRSGISLPVLSMGMSSDFEVAVEEGATEIRIGTALFGAREAKPA